MRLLYRRILMRGLPVARFARALIAAAIAIVRTNGLTRVDCYEQPWPLTRARLLEGERLM